MADSIKSFYISCASTLGLGDLTKVKTGDERAELQNALMVILKQQKKAMKDLDQLIFQH